MDQTNMPGEEEKDDTTMPATPMEPTTEGDDNAGGDMAA